MHLPEIGGVIVVFLDDLPKQLFQHPPLHAPDHMVSVVVVCGVWDEVLNDVESWFSVFTVALWAGGLLFVVLVNCALIDSEFFLHSLPFLSAHQLHQVRNCRLEQVLNCLLWKLLELFVLVFDVLELHLARYLYPSLEWLFGPHLVLERSVYIASHLVFREDHHYWTGFHSCNLIYEVLLSIKDVFFIVNLEEKVRVAKE